MEPNNTKEQEERTQLTVAPEEARKRWNLRTEDDNNKPMTRQEYLAHGYLDRATRWKYLLPR